MRWLLALLLSTALAHAGQTYVLAAGVEKYDDERVSGLQYAVADAKALAASFRAAGVPPRNVTVLTSDEPAGARRPTRINLLTALERIKEQVTQDDKVVFFFAGHGVEQNGEHFLLSCDTRRSMIQATSLPMALVNEALQGIQAGEVLFLIDACRNDPQAGRAASDATLSDGLARGLRPKLTAQPAGPKPRLVATLLACDVGQRAWEDPATGHGVFTLYLLKGLAGAAAAGGPVKLSGLATYVTTQIRDWAARSNRQQVPRLVNPDGGDMVVLIPPTEPVVSVQLTQQTLAAVVGLLTEQYGVQIVLGKGVNAEAKVTGRLDNLPLAQVLRILLAAYDLQVRRDGAVYVIEGKDAKPAPAEQQRPTVVVAADGSGQVRTITGALRLAHKGTLILVKPGVYRETVTVDKEVEIRGEGPKEQVVVQTLAADCFKVRAECVIVGLTAQVDAPAVVDAARPVAAAAVYVYGGDVTLRDCVLANDCDGRGHCFALGVDTPKGRARLSGCQLVARGGLAAGIDVSNRGQAWLTDSTVSGNWAVNSQCGGRVTASRCRFVGISRGLWVGNSAPGKYWDDGPAEALIEDCVVEGEVDVSEASRLVLQRSRVGTSHGPAIRIRDRSLVVLKDLRLAAADPQSIEIESGCLVDQQGVSVEGKGPLPDKGLGPILTVAPEGQPYRAISEAVKAAEPGAVILVKPGVYRETVTVDKNLTIRADGRWGEVVVEAFEQSALVARAPERLTVVGLTVRQTGKSRPKATPTERDAAPQAVYCARGNLELQACDVSTGWDLPWATSGAKPLGGGSLNATASRFSGARSPLLVAGSSCRLEACWLRGEVGVFVLEAGDLTVNGGEIVSATTSAVVLSVSSRQKTAPGRATLTACTLTASSGLDASAGGEAKLSRCRITNCADVAVVVGSASRIVTDHCTLTGNKGGAFRIEPGGKLEANGNTYDPGDKTVPK